MKSIMFAAAAISVAFLSVPAFADESGPDFAFKHPGRTEVVYRIERVKWIVDSRAQDGDFTPDQARALKSQADGIRAEEQFFASRHDGRIFIAEENKLIFEINQLARQINT